MSTNIYNLKVNRIDGSEVNLSEFQGKTLVFVNVASKCGLTPQYKEIESFYKNYKSKGVEVLGFPANNFGAQEPGTDAEIKQFCEDNYQVSFPMFSKISVKGEDQHELYSLLTQEAQADISWNFQKIIVDKNGKISRSFAPEISVNAPEFQEFIESIL